MGVLKKEHPKEVVRTQFIIVQLFTDSIKMSTKWGWVMGAGLAKQLSCTTISLGFGMNSSLRILWKGLKANKLNLSMALLMMGFTSINQYLQLKLCLLIEVSVGNKIYNNLPCYKSYLWKALKCTVCPTIWVSPHVKQMWGTNKWSTV